MSERVDTTALRDSTYWLERDSIRHALEHAATADGFRHDWYSDDVAPLVATIRKSADEIDALRAVIADVKKWRQFWWDHLGNGQSPDLVHLRIILSNATSESRVEGTTR